MSTAPRPGRGSQIREELQRMLDGSTTVDEFAQGLLGFLVDLAGTHPDHPVLATLGAQLGQAASAPLAVAAMHDLRSILQGVTAGLEHAPGLLERSGLLSAARAGQVDIDHRRVELLLEAIDDASNGARLAGELAGDTLRIARDCMLPPTRAGLDRHHAAAASSRSPLNQLVATATRIAGRGVELEVRLETPDTLEIAAPRAAVMRVLINLLRNATHAIDELEDPIGAKITVTSWASDEFAWVQVADDGPGIPAQTLPAIFELFFTTHAEGTGVGLFACKRLVSGWGGTLHVDSRDREGARFTFNIPRCADLARDPE